MLVLPTLHTYLTQLLSPPLIHTALLLTPEGALVSYASRMEGENESGAPSRAGSSSGGSAASGSRSPSGPSSPKSNTSRSISSGVPSTPQPLKQQRNHAQPGPRPRSKDEIRIVAGLSAEVWAETRGEDGEGEEGMVESELGRILVLPVEERKKGDEEGEEQEPLLLLALNGTLDAEWDIMSIKAHKLAAFLAPSVNKHRGLMQVPLVSPVSPGNGGSNGGKSRTRSTATSPGRGINR